MKKAKVAKYSKLVKQSSVVLVDISEIVDVTNLKTKKISPLALEKINHAEYNSLKSKSKAVSNKFNDKQQRTTSNNDVDGKKRVIMTYAQF